MGHPDLDRYCLRARRIGTVGSRAPPSLKIFLLALAIIKDFGAIIVIAVFYTAELSLIALILAGVGAAALVALNLSGASHRATYMLVGMSIWVCVLKSGIHATLAGVVDLRLSCLAGASSRRSTIIAHSRGPQRNAAGSSGRPI